jgi:hypothetical protein
MNQWWGFSSLKQVCGYWKYISEGLFLSMNNESGTGAAVISHFVWMDEYFLNGSQESHGPSP